MEPDTNKVSPSVRAGFYLLEAMVIVGVGCYFAWMEHSSHGMPWWPDAVQSGLKAAGMLAFLFLMLVPESVLVLVLGWLFRPIYVCFDRHAPDAVRLVVIWSIALLVLALIAGMLFMGGHALLIKLGWLYGGR